MFFKVAETVTKLSLIGGFIVCNGWFVWWAFNNTADLLGMLVAVSICLFFFALFIKCFRLPIAGVAMASGLVAGL